MKRRWFVTNLFVAVARTGDSKKMVYYKLIYHGSCNSQKVVYHRFIYSGCYNGSKEILSG